MRLFQVFVGTPETQ